MSVWTSTCVDSNGVATLQGFECILRNVFNLIIPLAGLAAFVTLIIGGFQYLTSAGDPKQTQKAQGIITGAIIGILVIIGIWFIFKMLHTVTGLDLLNFTIPGSPACPVCSTGQICCAPQNCYPISGNPTRTFCQ